MAARDLGAEDEVSGRPLAAVPLVLLLALTGCSGPAPLPSTADLVGTWRQQSSPRLVLRADRTCTATSLADGPTVTSGTCTWRVERTRAADGHPVVRLDFTADPSAAVTVARYEIDGSGSGTTLFQDVNGDPSDRDVLRR